MNDQTTTEEVVETGAEEAQPVEETTNTEAVQEDVNEEQQSTEEPSNEDDNSKWLESKGIDPSDPEAIAKVSKMAREAEKTMHAKAQQKSELEKGMVEQVQSEAEAVGMTDQDRVLVQQIAVKQTVRDFWDNNPDAREYEQSMVEVLANKPHLAGDLDALYAVALREGGAIESSKTQGGKEALTKLASKQRAASPTGSAVSAAIPNNKVTLDTVRQKTEEGDIAWINAHQSEINKLAQG